MGPPASQGLPPQGRGREEARFSSPCVRGQVQLGGGGFQSLEPPTWAGPGARPSTLTPRQAGPLRSWGAGPLSSSTPISPPWAEDLCLSWRLTQPVASLFDTQSLLPAGPPPQRPRTHVHASRLGHLLQAASLEASPLWVPTTPEFPSSHHAVWAAFESVSFAPSSRGHPDVWDP